jgi:hypothetical protein
MFKNTTTALLLLLAVVGTAPLLAAEADASVSQIYEAARTGHLADAQQMINQVLRDHPTSGRAHYVAAELDARGGNMSGAQRELNTAQQLEPGLPFAKTEAVAALRREIAQGARVGGYAVPLAGHSGGSSLPWGIIGLVLAGLAIVWLLVRRRSAPVASYSAYPSAVPGAPGMPGTMGAAGGFPSVVPGAGGGLMGGLASGLAVGAGLAAGEELVHHVFDGDRAVGGQLPLANELPPEPPVNNDLGGTDFGMQDPGSWDDSASSNDDSGGDWT